MPGLRPEEPVAGGAPGGCLSATNAADGWLSYHWHRGLPSLAAEFAAQAAVLAAGRAGAGLWRGLLQRAIEAAHGRVAPAGPGAG